MGGGASAPAANQKYEGKDSNVDVVGDKDASPFESSPFDESPFGADDGGGITASMSNDPSSKDVKLNSDGTPQKEQVASATKLKRMALGQQTYMDKDRDYDNTLSKLDLNKSGTVDWSPPPSGIKSGTGSSGKHNPNGTPSRAAGSKFADHSYLSPSDAKLSTPEAAKRAVSMGKKPPPPSVKPAGLTPGPPLNAAGPGSINPTMKPVAAPSHIRLQHPNNPGNSIGPPGRFGAPPGSIGAGAGAGTPPTAAGGPPTGPGHPYHASSFSHGSPVVPAGQTQFAGNRAQSMNGGVVMTGPAAGGGPPPGIISRPFPGSRPAAPGAGGAGGEMISMSEKEEAMIGDFAAGLAPVEDSKKPANVPSLNLLPAIAHTSSSNSVGGGGANNNSSSSTSSDALTITRAPSNAAAIARPPSMQLIQPQLSMGGGGGGGGGGGMGYISSQQSQQQLHLAPSPGHLQHAQTYAHGATPYHGLNAGGGLVLVQPQQQQPSTAPALATSTGTGAATATVAASPGGHNNNRTPHGAGPQQQKSVSARPMPAPKPKGGAPLTAPVVKETKNVKRNRAQIPTKLTHARPTTGDWLNKRYIVNNYILLEVLGTGSYGEVRLCKDRTTDKLFAIKIFSKDFLKKKKMGKSDETFFEDIKREIAIMKKLLHPNVLRLFEVLDDPKVNKMYLVLEYMKMGDFIHVLKNRPDEHGNLPEKDPKNPDAFTPLNDMEVWNVFRQVVSGIRYLHYQNVVHGDIKPHNLLLGEDGVVKIADFGISQMLSASGQKLADAAGTPAFMSPELCQKKVEEFSGQLADIWAIGATIYMLRFGNPPFIANNILDLYNKICNDTLTFPGPIDPGLKNLLENMLEKEASRRYTLQQIIIHPWFRHPPSVRGQLSKRAGSGSGTGSGTGSASSGLGGGASTGTGSSTKLGAFAASHSNSSFNSSSSSSSTREGLQGAVNTVKALQRVHSALTFKPPEGYEAENEAALKVQVKIEDGDEVFQSIGGIERKIVKVSSGGSKSKKSPGSSFKQNNKSGTAGSNAAAGGEEGKTGAEGAKDGSSSNMMGTEWGADVFEIVEDDELDDDDDDDDEEEEEEEYEVDDDELGDLDEDSEDEDEDEVDQGNGEAQSQPAGKGGRPMGVFGAGGKGAAPTATRGDKQEEDDDEKNDKGGGLESKHGSNGSLTRKEMSQEEEAKRANRFAKKIARKSDDSGMELNLLPQIAVGGEAAEGKGGGRDVGGAKSRDSDGGGGGSGDASTGSTPNQVKSTASLAGLGLNNNSNSNNNSLNNGNRKSGKPGPPAFPADSKPVPPARGSALKVDQNGSDSSLSDGSGATGKAAKLPFRSINHKNSNAGRSGGSSGGSGSGTPAAGMGVACGASSLSIRSTMSMDGDDDDAEEVNMQDFNAMMDTLAMQPRAGRRRGAGEGDGDDIDEDDEEDDEDDGQPLGSDGQLLPITGFSAELCNPINGIATAFHSEKGTRHSQEDRCVILPNASQMKDFTDLAVGQLPANRLEELSKFSVACVFDGHSGWRSSQYLSQHFVPMLVTHEKFLDKQCEYAINDVCLKIDDKICSMLIEEADESGSTGIVAVYDGRKQKFTVAWVGDSACVLSRGGKAVSLTKMHRAIDNQEERERVKKAGGTIINNRVNGLLAVTRAFGDTQFKADREDATAVPVGRKHSPISSSSSSSASAASTTASSKPGTGSASASAGMSSQTHDLVIAKPEIYTELITPKTEFAVLATDGLWDVMSPQVVVSFVRKRIGEHRDLEEATRELTSEALARGSVDNVTACIVTFHFSE